MSRSNPSKLVTSVIWPAIWPAIWAVLAAPWLAGCAREGAAGPTRKLATGLEITELVEGTGAAAADGDWVEVHYDARILGPSAGGDARAVGTTAGGDATARAQSGDGPAAPFDSTRGGEPLVFRLGRSKVLAAFADGVTGMRDGGRRRLTIPPELAYGALGKGVVPPGATLAYDVELVRRFTRSQAGIAYVELKRGSGRGPKAGERVVIRCREWLVETGRSILEPKRERAGYEFELGSGAAIPALEKVLPEMSVGSIWRLGVAPEDGYGTAGHIPILVAGQDVLLDVELTSIRDKP